MCLNFMKNFYNILFFILVLATISSCSLSYNANNYHKPIVKNKPKQGDSIVPLLYFRMLKDGWTDEHSFLQFDSVATELGIHRMKIIDSVYPFRVYSGKDNCEIHHCLLQIDTVSIGYGFFISGIEIKKGSLEAERK